MLTLINAGFLTVSLKRAGWCWWHHSSERGLRAIQFGPLILELA